VIPVDSSDSCEAVGSRHGEHCPTAMTEGFGRNSVLVKKKKDRDGRDAFLLSVTRGSTISCLRTSFSAISGGFWIPGYRWKAGRKAQAPTYVLTFLTFLVASSNGLHSIVHSDLF